MEEEDQDVRMETAGKNDLYPSHAAATAPDRRAAPDPRTTAPDRRTADRAAHASTRVFG